MPHEKEEQLCRAGVQGAERHVSRHVYIYTGEGASEASVQGWQDSLREILGHPSDRVRMTNADTFCLDLVAQRPEETAVIMPGGADLPFLARLGGEPVHRLRKVVSEGGSYVGSCAGAYFASASCVFEPNHAELRVVGKRPLCLFEYDAVGAVRAGFAYGSRAGATVERLKCRWGDESFDADVYCNGGCGWANVVEDGYTRVVARYGEAVLRRHGVDEVSPAAVVCKRFGRGNVVLSGVHPEMTAGGEGPGRDKLLWCVSVGAML